MKNPHPFRIMRFGWKAGMLALTGLLVALANAPAQVWTNINDGNASGLWSTPANWSPNAVPNAQDAVADFSTLTITNNSFITNDAPVTVGTLVFANPTANGTTWTLDGAGGNLITLDKSSGIPTIAVTNAQVLIGGLSGLQGFEKTGNGALAIYGTNYGNNVSGTIHVKGGLLSMVNGQSFLGIPGDIIVESGASFAANAKFDGSIFYNNFYLNGTGGAASGFVNNASTPEGVYNGAPQPMGALDIYGNTTINGSITLGSDVKITHGYNFGWINGSIIVTNAGQNLELVTRIASGSGGGPLFMGGEINLGTGTLTISGGGLSASSVVLIGGFFGANTYAGGTIINGGNVILASGYPDTMDTTSGLTFTGAGGALDLGGNSQTLPFLTGPAGLIKGNNTGLGAPVLTIDQSIDTVFGGGFEDGASNILAVVKQGTGSLTVGGMSSHSGPTTVSAGRLLGSSGGGITNSVIQMANGTTNGYVATIPGGQWTCKELIYDAGTTHIRYDFGGQTVDTAYPSPVMVNGDVTINGTLNFAVTNGIWLYTGTYPLLSYSGTLTPSPTINLVGLPAGVSATLSNDVANKRIALIVSTIPPVVLPGVTNGVWTSLAYGAPTDYFWSLGTNWSGGVVADGASATADFSTLGITNNAFVTNDAPRSIGNLLFANTDTNFNSGTNSKTWTLYGGAVNKMTLASLTTAKPVIQVDNNEALVGGLSGSVGFIKNGNGVLAIVGNGHNPVTGPITVSEGILGAGTGLAFAGITGPITVAAGATFDVNGNFDGASLGNNITLNGTGVGAIPPGYIANAPTPDGFTYRGTVAPLGAIDLHHNAVLTGTITLNTDSRITHSWNASTINGPIVAAGAGKNLELRNSWTGGGSADLTIGGSISLGTGSVTINSAAVVGSQLNNSNSYSGGTYLLGGKLRVGNVNALSGGALTMTGGFVQMFNTDLVVSSLSGVSGTGIGSLGATVGTSTLTVNQSVATIYSGVITNGPVRPVALTKAGTGELALAGTNNYSGATMVSGGRLLGVTGGSSSNSLHQIADGAGNGVRVVTPGGQWVGGAVTYDTAGTQSVLFDFTTNAASLSVAPLSVNGTVAFDGTVTAVITNGVWFGTNNYPLLVASGGFSGTPPTSVVLPPSVGGYLQVAGNTLYLNVTNAPAAAAPAPTILPVYKDGSGNLVISTVTTAGYNYLLLSTTNLASSPVVWVTNSTTAGTGGPITNVVPISATPPNQFFRYLVQ